MENLNEIAGRVRPILKRKPIRKVHLSIKEELEVVDALKDMASKDSQIYGKPDYQLSVNNILLKLAEIIKDAGLPAAKRFCTRNRIEERLGHNVISKLTNSLHGRNIKKSFDELFFEDPIEENDMNNMRELLNVMEGFGMDDGIHIGAKVQPRWDKGGGEPFEVIGIFDDQKVIVVDDFGNTHNMLITDLVPVSDSVMEGTWRSKDMILADSLEDIANKNKLKRMVSDQELITFNTILHRIASALRNGGFTAARNFCKQNNIESQVDYDVEDELSRMLAVDYGSKETFDELFFTDYNKITQPSDRENQFADALDNIARDPELVAGLKYPDPIDAKDAKNTIDFLKTVSRFIRAQGMYQARKYAKHRKLSIQWDEFVNQKLRGAGFRNGWWQNIESMDEPVMEKSTSEKQARFMAACAHGADYDSCPPKKVSKEFNKADKGTKQLSNAMKHMEESHVSKGQMSNPGVAREILAMEGSDYENDLNFISQSIRSLYDMSTSEDNLKQMVAAQTGYGHNPDFEDMFFSALNHFLNGEDSMSGDDMEDDYTDRAMRKGELGDPSIDMDEGYNMKVNEDFQNGYNNIHYASGNDYFPNGADGPVVRKVGPSGARHGDNPEQKAMQIAEVHKELVYGYRAFLNETAQKR